MQPSIASTLSSSELKAAYFSLCLDSLENNPSTAFIQKAWVKWNVQPGWPLSHSRTSADLWEKTLARTAST